MLGYSFCRGVTLLAAFHIQRASHCALQPSRARGLLAPLVLQPRNADLALA